MDRCAMHLREASGNFDCTRNILRLDRAHADHHVAMKAARRLARRIRAIHCDVHALLDMAQRNAAFDQGILERKTAADQERDEIIAPIVADVRHFLLQHTALEYPVTGQVGPDIGTRRAARFELPCFQHFNQRAGLRIALAEQQQIECIVARHDHHVGLHESFGKARCRPGEGSAAAKSTQRLRRVRLCFHPISKSNGARVGVCARKDNAVPRMRCEARRDITASGWAAPSRFAGRNTGSVPLPSSARTAAMPSSRYG